MLPYVKTENVMISAEYFVFCDKRAADCVSVTL